MSGNILLNLILGGDINKSLQTKFVKSPIYKGKKKLKIIIKNT